jgi:hypothetical protein
MPKQQYYGRQKYEFNFTGDSLEARCNLPFGPKRNCVLFSALLNGLAVWGIYRTWLWAGPYGHSTLWYLAHHDSVLDSGAVVFGTGSYILFLLLAIRLVCPAGAILSCDRSQVTTTRIPWYSFTGRWVTHTYNALDVSGFCLKYFGSGRGGSVYGIRFFVNGSKKTIFRGSIEPPEAYRILRGLKGLGHDVPHDSKLLSRVKLGLLDREEDELDRRMRI